MKRHRCEKRTLPIASPRIVAAPSASFLEFHRTVLACERWGHEVRTAFVLAAQLKGAGINAAEAEKMFSDAEERLQ